MAIAPGPGPSGNIFFSTSCVYAMLGMTYTGASGSPASKMVPALVLAATKEQIRSVFEDLSETGQDNAQRGGNNLNIATTLSVLSGSQSLL